MIYAYGRLIKITYTNKRGTKLTEVADTSKHAYLDADPQVAPWEWAQEWVTQYKQGTTLWGILISDTQIGKHIFLPDNQPQRIPIVGETWERAKDKNAVEVVAVEFRKFSRGEAEKQMIQTRDHRRPKCFTWHSLQSFLHNYSPMGGAA